MKKLAQAFIIVFAAAALIACSKTTIIYDQSLALERTTTITLPVAITGGSIEVTNYNGAQVSWESSFGGTEIKLPAGKTTLVFNAIERGASYVYSADNLSFTRDFAAGKSYVITFVVWNKEATILIKDENDELIDSVSWQLNWNQ